MNWLIMGTAPLVSWRIFTDDGLVMARGTTLSRRRARRHVSEYLEMA